MEEGKLAAVPAQEAVASLATWRRVAPAATKDGVAGLADPVLAVVVVV